MPGSSGADRDPYQWLERLGKQAPVVQLQQTDGQADRHWPFSTRNNPTGIIKPERVLAALDASGADEVALILQIVPGAGQDDEQVLTELRQSVQHWKSALAAHAPAGGH